MRELEAGDCDAALREWEGDSAGADGELQHGPVPGQFGEQVDRGVQHVGLEHVGHGFVIVAVEAAATGFAVEVIAQDRERPRLKIGAGGIAFARRPSPHQSFLGQIVGAIAATAQGTRESAQMRGHIRQCALEFAIAERNALGLHVNHGILRRCGFLRCGHTE